MGFIGHSKPYTVRTDNAPKVRFSATLGQEPEIERTDVPQQRVAGDRHAEFVKKPRSGLTSEGKRDVSEQPVQPAGATCVVGDAPGSRSAKIALSQKVGSSQKNWRTRRCTLTQMPCQGSSESVRR